MTKNIATFSTPEFIKKTFSSNIDSLPCEGNMRTIFTAFIITILLTPTLFAQWTDMQSAEFVIGQPNFTTNIYTCSANSLAGPYSVAIDFQHSKLYIGDADNRRVLRYAYPITGNQPTAELVFGQSNFTTDSVQDFYNRMGWWPDPTAKQILYPMAIAVYNGDLWVLDEFNERVVRFAQAYNQTENNPNADLVIGQGNFATRDYACTANSFTTPWGMTIDGSGNLWVADAGNGRVLRFNDVSSLTNGASANGVLGQTNFTTGAMASTPTQNQFALASSLCFSGTTLWLCDYQFHRVLRFDSAATKPNGANADGVLGQSNYTSNTYGTTPSTFHQPFGVCADGKGNLYVSDQMNNRVVIFHSAVNKANGSNADNELGQSGFYTTSHTYDSTGFAPQSVTNFAVDNANGKLFVVDRRGMRVMQFTASSPLTGVEPNKTSGLSGIPTQFQISNYPNPFNPTTNISISVPFKSSVTVDVYDVLGRKIKTLLQGEMVTGNYNLVFDGNTLPSGVYYCRMKAGDVIQTRKIFLLK
jgi:hypothetical protein